MEGQATRGGNNNSRSTNSSRSTNNTNISKLTQLLHCMCLRLRKHHLRRNNNHSLDNLLWACPCNR